jgi:hypothetical protein
MTLTDGSQFVMIQRRGAPGVSSKRCRARRETGATPSRRAWKRSNPHGARVFAIADALDALTVKRSYREAVGFEAAVTEIAARSGTAYDPQVIQSALKASDELKTYVGRIVMDTLQQGG